MWVNFAFTLLVLCPTDGWQYWSLALFNPLPAKELVVLVHFSFENSLKNGLSVPAKTHFENLLVRMHGVQTVAHVAC